MADVEKLAHAAMNAVTQEDWQKYVAHAEKIQDEDNSKENIEGCHVGADHYHITRRR